MIYRFKILQKSCIRSQFCVKCKYISSKCAFDFWIFVLAFSLILSAILLEYDALLQNTNSFHLYNIIILGFVMLQYFNWLAYKQKQGKINRTYNNFLTAYIKSAYWFIQISCLFRTRHKYFFSGFVYWQPFPKEAITQTA